MKKHEATGKTVEEAISQGLSDLNLSIGDVTVDILEEGSKGLFGLFGSREARVRLTVKEDENATTKSVFEDALSVKAEPDKAPRADKPARAPKKAADKPREDKADRPAREPKKAADKPARRPQKERQPEAVEPAEDKPVVPAETLDPATLPGKAQAFVKELTTLMSVPVEVHAGQDEEGNIRINLQGDKQGILIGRRGETLDALQYLTSLHINRELENYTRVTIDSEDYRAKREEALIRLANRMANKAVRTGRKVKMEPMNPYERRILHSALQAHNGVATHSEGEEPNRYVVITVAKTVDQD